MSCLAAPAVVCRGIVVEEVEVRELAQVLHQLLSEMVQMVLDRELEAAAAMAVETMVYKGREVRVLGEKFIFRIPFTSKFK
jgi:hypothetical protein